MLIIKNGKTIKRSWRVYLCDFCGQMEAECKRRAQSNGPSYSNDVLEDFADYTNRDETVHFCKNCGREMHQPELTSKEYIDALNGKEIPLCNYHTKTLTEDDLFYV